MTDVDAARVLMRSSAIAMASSDAASYLAISYGSAPKARTTRMPVKFSSMIWPRVPMRSCRASHRARRRSRAVEDCHATNGTKEKLNVPSSGSLVSSRYPPAPIRLINSTRRSSPVLTNMRTPSRSSMPRVINSPVCTLSWKEKLRLCSFL